MILPIRTLGDPVLREPAKPVTDFDRAFRRLCDDMIETMYAAPGVGLAGPQVGVSLRVFVFDDGETGPQVVANPELAEGAGDLTEEEGCLSIPGPYHATPRLAAIRCRGADASGKAVDMIGEGLVARIFQHETDHLDGMLYLDRLSPEDRRRALTLLREQELGAGRARRLPRPQ